MTKCARRVRTGMGALLREVGDELVDRAIPLLVRPGERTFRLEVPVRAGHAGEGGVAAWTGRSGLPRQSPANSYGLLQHLGQVHRNRVRVAEDVNLDPAQLAFAIRVDEDEVLGRRYTPGDPGRVLFHGLEVNPKRIETGRRRFSPTMFGREPADSPHFHRAIWELRDIPFCLEG